MGIDEQWSTNRQSAFLGLDFMVDVHLEEQSECGRCRRKYPFGDGMAWQCILCGEIYCDKCFREDEKILLVCNGCDEWSKRGSDGCR